MRKVILKTALITFAVAVILGISAFGIASFVTPAAMMRLCDSLGLESISGDYAYQQYQLNGDIDYLARAFEIAAAKKKDSVAVSRFNELYGEEDSERRALFGEYCAQQNPPEDSRVPGSVLGYDYRSVVCAQAALAKYRLAVTDADKAEVCAFAIAETGFELAAECPVVALAAESTGRGDKAFSALLLNAMKNGNFNTGNNFYIRTANILEESIHE